jgi:hypothetical protein
VSAISNAYHAAPHGLLKRPVGPCRSEDQFDNEGDEDEEMRQMTEIGRRGETRGDEGEMREMRGDGGEMRRAARWFCPVVPALCRFPPVVSAGDL